MSHIIALIFDFDITLSPTFQQQVLFDEWDLDAHSFWRECDQLGSKGYDYVIEIKARQFALIKFVDEKWNTMKYHTPKQSGNQGGSKRINPHFVRRNALRWLRSTNFFMSLLIGKPLKMALLRYVERFSENCKFLQLTKACR